MSLGVHTTAVVQGEAARLVEELGAGVVVPPENPEALANAWAMLIDDRSKLTVSPSGREWVIEQRDGVVPEAFLNIIDRVNEQKRSAPSSRTFQSIQPGSKIRK